MLSCPARNHPSGTEESSAINRTSLYRTVCACDASLLASLCAFATRLLLTTDGGEGRRCISFTRWSDGVLFTRRSGGAMIA